MDDLNACAECGYTTKDMVDFNNHVERHEKDVRLEEVTQVSHSKSERNNMEGLNDSSAFDNVTLLANFNRLLAASAAATRFISTKEIPKSTLVMQNGLSSVPIKEEIVSHDLTVDVASLQIPKSEVPSEISPMKIQTPQATTKNGRSPKGEKTIHSCPHCNFTTYMSQHMKSHLEAHERHQGQMYQCDICQMQFSQKANMHRHRMRHSGLKPYKCRFCSKDFFRKDQMQEHSMTHIKTGEDFDCPVVNCTQQFHQHSTLRQHLDEDHTITASQQASCKRCSLMFSNPRRILLHYQTKHDDMGMSVESMSQKRPSSNDPVMTSGISSPISAEHLNLMSTAMKLISHNAEVMSGEHSFEDNEQSNVKRRRTSSSKKSKVKPGAQIADNAGISYNVENLLKCEASKDNREIPNSPDAENGDVADNDGSSSNVSEYTANSLSQPGSPKAVPQSFMKPNERTDRPLFNDFSALLSPNINQFLPRSKSPDYRNLILNGYRLNNNDIFMKLATASGQHELANFDASKINQQAMHMQLWTNSANSATTNTGTSSCSDLHNQDDAGHQNHSSTHSPSACSSSTVSSGRESHQHQPSEFTISGSGASDTEFLPVDYCTTSTQEIISIQDSNAAQLCSNSNLLPRAENTASKEPMECLHCGIVFLDQTLHLLHKGLHNDSDPWRCNLCGQACGDRYTFTTHMIRSDHS
ncbi:asparagine-rich zinc finger protein AZF1 [Ditylenchus destructor]|uniref:Asparagine-rich zinc finger protein AZF1 n=1 Tax=Ditylenchus destructor TaxID=166010 RepID=A0AAD4NB39_9BILA|nr:asparagine-rich zinc finger protein AZF1 [Ditylenchus destructor]